jgi:predicted negative regulator of RcsB-dependent stress response
MSPAIRRLARALVPAAALAAALGGGCAMRTPDWTATVAARHAEADRLLDAGDRAAARRVLASIVSEAPEEAPGEHAAPGLPRRAEARRVLLQDTYFRLARLALDQGQPARAIDEAGRGLALGGGGDLFTANLLVVRGAARAAAGETRVAMEDYHRALEINDDLLGRVLLGR